MKRESFNSGWLFCRGSGTALERTISGAQTPVPVMLPHDAMIGTARDPQTPTGNATGYYLRDGKSAVLGFGSADPKSEENYFDKTIRTWHGRALIVTRGEGELKIEVK